MDCMGVKGSGTAYVEFDEVRVPKKNLVGDITILLRYYQNLNTLRTCLIVLCEFFAVVMFIVLVLLVMFCCGYCTVL